MKKLILGDFHVAEKRTKAINLAFNEIKSHIKPKDKFDYALLTGDIWNKYPTMLERLMFAKFLSYLFTVTDKVIVIEGTDTHDYSKSIFNLEDLTILLNKKLISKKRFKDNKFLFVHEPIKGAKYDNGVKEKAGLDTSKLKETVISGHYHSGYEENNLVIVGSIYRTNFSQKDDKKRIIIIEDNKIKYLSIKSRPMYEIHLEGNKGKVICPELKLIKELPKDSEIDLKIIASTDTQTLPSIHSNIAKIKKLKLNGGGGTSHEPLMEYIKEKHRDCKLAIFFTDGYSDLDDFDMNKYRFSKMFLISEGGTADQLKGKPAKVIKLDEYK